jgi:succinate dehydrogenase / fumarate reductase iron-sulfur subunit
LTGVTAQWTVEFRVRRQRTGGQPHWQSFSLTVSPDEYVLDAVERIWAFHDRSLTFRHACHHSTCGACGMLVNGQEKLTCITPIREVTRHGGTVRLEPMRNFPVLSDLVVDMTVFYRHMEQSGYQSVTPLKQAGLPFEPPEFFNEQGYERLADCIECGLCISACPISLTTSAYFGPAVLAGIQDTLAHGRDPDVWRLADCEHGAWRCHSAFECSAVCPSNVDPGWRIMDLRRRIIAQRINQFFHPRQEARR